MTAWLAEHTLWLTHLAAFAAGLFVATYYSHVLDEIRGWALSAFTAIGIVAVVVVPAVHFGWFT